MNGSEIFDNQLGQTNDFDESLTVSAVEEQIKQVNEMLKARDISLKEALDLKQSLEQKKSQIQLGDQVAESVLANIDNQEIAVEKDRNDETGTQGKQVLTDLRTGKQGQNNSGQTPGVTLTTEPDDPKAMPDYSAIHSASENAKKSGQARSVGAMAVAPDNNLGSQKPLTKLSKEEIDTIVHDFGEKMNQSPKEYQDLYPKLKPYLKQQRKLERRALEAEIQNMSLDELEEKVDSEMAKMKRGDMSQQLGYKQMTPYVRKIDELKKERKEKMNQNAEENQRDKKQNQEPVVNKPPSKEGVKAVESNKKIQEGGQQSGENFTEQEKNGDKIKEISHMEQIKHQTDFFKEEPDNPDKPEAGQLDKEPITYPQITEQADAFTEAPEAPEAAEASGAGSQVKSEPGVTETKELSQTEQLNQQIGNLKDEIDTINSEVQRSRMSTEKADVAVAERENQIYELELQIRKEQVAPQIAELKEKINVINEEVRGGRKKIDQADAEVAELENSIYALEQSVSDKAPTSNEKTEETTTGEGSGATSSQDEVVGDFVGPMKSENDEGFVGPQPQSENDKTRREFVGPVDSPINEDFVGAPNPNEDNEGREAKLEGLNQKQIEKQEKAEYLGLKRQFKEAEANYQKVLSDDFANRGSFKKMFGFGRNTQSAEVHTAYDEMMQANKAYFQAGESLGIYDKINDRLNRDRERNRSFIQDFANENSLDAAELLELDSQEKLQSYANEKSLDVTDLQEAVAKTLSFADAEAPDIKVGIANRHVVRSAEKRLEIQSRELPPGLRKVKENLTSAIKNNPKTAAVVGLVFAGSLIALNPTRVLVGGTVGFASKYFSKLAGDKFYVGRKIKNLESVRTRGAEAFDGSIDIDLEKLENDYFKSLEALDTAKQRTKLASTAVGIGAGVTAGANADSIIDNVKDVLGFGAPENLPSWQTGPMDLEAGSATENPTVSKDGSVSATESGDASPTISETEGVSDTAAMTESPAVGSEAAPVAPEAAANGNEAIFEPHVIKKDDTVSEVLTNAIKEKLARGEIKLPPGVSEDEITHRMYQTFPEMTEAEGVPPKLKPGDWEEIMGTTNFRKLQIGDTIDVQRLVDEMWTGDSSLEVVPGTSEQASAGFGEVSGDQADAVPSMFDEGQGPIDGYTTLGDVEGAQAATAAADAGPSVPVSDVTPETNPEQYEPAVNINEDGTINTIKNLDEPYLKAMAETSFGYEMADSARESVSEFIGPTSTKDAIFYRLTNLIDGGEIKLLEDMVVDNVNYKENLMGLIETRLPELAPAKYPNAKPTLNAKEWALLGVPNVDPANIALQPGDKLMTGRLMQFILSGDKSVLFPKP